PWTYYASALGAALVLAATAVVVLPDPPARRVAGGLDLPGAATAALGLTALVWALTAARRTGWTDPQVLVALATATALLPLFVRLERRHPHPLLPPRLLRTGRVAAGNLLMALLGSVWIALFYLLPLYQQRVLGDGPLAAGLGQLPLAAANMAGSWLAPRAARRFGAAPVPAAALLIGAAGLLWLTRISADGSFALDLLGPSIAVGLGLGAAFAQLTGIAVTGVAPTDSGLAGGLVNTTRQVGGAIGLAVLGTLAAAVTAGAAPTRPPLDALTAGYRAAFLGGALVLALAAALALLLLRHPRPTARTRDVRTRHAHHVRTHHQGDHAMPTHTHTIDTTAPVVVRLAITVDAPPALVWALHTDVEAWPSWNPDVEQARLDGGPLTGPGTSFTWRTHGLDITSTVRELAPGRRIVWGGPANGIEGIHVWSFEAAGDGRVTVRTEESWSGPAVDAMPEALEQALRESLERWLDHLRATAEGAHRAATAG
ncbi:MFS transporter, partial [Kitasatospora sp. NPDC057542]|uniref:MFS transporter n=2 Tax=Streptomycetaceae TaxID=2062 RepID=UPI00369F33E4